MSVELILVLVLLVLLIVCFIFIEPAISKHKVKNKNEYGSAHFSSVEEIKKNFPYRIKCFVAVDEDKVLGTASIDNIKSMYGVEVENSNNKYIILTVFTHLEYQNQGIGKALIQKIDEYAEAIGAEEVLILASVYGLEFYRKLGYDFYNGNSSQNKDGEYILSKHFNKKTKNL